MRRLVVLALIFGGCATSQTQMRSTPPPVYTLDLSQIPEGYNCFPVVPGRAESCSWRLKSAV